MYFIFSRRICEINDFQIIAEVLVERKLSCTGCLSFHGYFFLIQNILRLYSFFGSTHKWPDLQQQSVSIGSKNSNLPTSPSTAVKWYTYLRSRPHFRKSVIISFLIVSVDADWKYLKIWSILISWSKWNEWKFIQSNHIISK